MDIKKMRVAVVTTYPPSTGTLNEYAYHFVRFLRRKPEIEEVVILADELSADVQYTDEAATADTAALRIIPCWRFDSAQNAGRILAAVRKIRPDVVLYNIQFASFGGRKSAAALGLLTPALTKYAGYPTVVLLHNIMETVDLQSARYASNALMEKLIYSFGTLVTRLLLQADLVALTIPKYVDILEKKYNAQNVVLAPHGSFDEAVSNPDFDLPAGPLKIMTFGKFGTYKKVEALIEAFEKLQRGVNDPLELVIAGSDSPNAQGYLDAVSRQYTAVPNISFTGYVAEEDVPRIFRESAVVVFPYTSTTGSSGVLHQAGNYGKATVLPNIGDFAEVITEEGYAGEFFEPDNPESMSAAIARVIKDPENRLRIGKQNFLASCGLPIEEVVDWYLLHFQHLIHKRSKTQ